MEGARAGGDAQILNLHRLTIGKGVVAQGRLATPKVDRTVDGERTKEMKTGLTANEGLAARDSGLAARPGYDRPKAVVSFRQQTTHRA